MRTNHSAFGSQRERAVAKLLEAERWEVVRTTGPRSTYDLVAMRACPFGADGLSYTRLIQVKGTQRSPWVAWGPAERAALREAAKRAGATPLLAWWPPHGPLQWYGEAEWPDAGRRPEDAQATRSAEAS